MISVFRATICATVFMITAGETVLLIVGEGPATITPAEEK